MAITQFPNCRNQFPSVVSVNCSYLVLVGQRVVECIYTRFPRLGLTWANISKLCVDVLHDQCHCLTFDAFLNVSFDYSVVSDNVIPKTPCIQSLLPSLLLGGRRHHARLLANFAEWVFGIVAKLVGTATGFFL